MLSKCKYSNKKQKHRERRQKKSNNTTNLTGHQTVTTHTKSPPPTALHHIITPFPHIKQRLCPTDGNSPKRKYNKIIKYHSPSQALVDDAERRGVSHYTSYKNGFSMPIFT